MVISEIDGYLYDIYKSLRGRTLSLPVGEGEDVYLRLSDEDLNLGGDPELNDWRLMGIKYATIESVGLGYCSSDCGLVCELERDGKTVLSFLDVLGEGNLKVVSGAVSRAMDTANRRFSNILYLRNCLKSDGSAFDLRDSEGRGIPVSVMGRSVEIESAFIDFSAVGDNPVIVYSLNIPNIRLAELSDEAVRRIYERAVSLRMRQNEEVSKNRSIVVKI